MKLQAVQLIRKSQLKSINDYICASSEKVNANFASTYLPLFYSGSIDLVMQNIVITIIGSIAKHLDLRAFVASIKDALPEVKSISLSPTGKMKIVLYSVQNRLVTLVFQKQESLIIPGFKLGGQAKETDIQHLRCYLISFIRQAIQKIDNNALKHEKKRKVSFIHKSGSVHLLDLNHTPPQLA